MGTGAGMGIARVSRAALERAVRETGLSLTAEQVWDIAETEIACLTACGRVSFGESAAARLVREFAASPFIVGGNAAEVVAELTEAFYELREAFSASITDVEILESLRESFDGDAAGDVSLAASLAADLLLKQLDYSTYEITDDDGDAYRWDPEEWREDEAAVVGGSVFRCDSEKWRGGVITEANGNVYRWDPEEWRDDVTADGWYGERWHEADE